MLEQATLYWNTHIIANFPLRPRLDRLKSTWRNRLVTRARAYFWFSDRSDSCERDRPDFEQLLFPIRSASVPRLRVRAVSQSSESNQTGLSKPGAHLIILVHGYQGSSYDVRVIRNQGMY